MRSRRGRTTLAVVLGTAVLIAGRASATTTTQLVSVASDESHGEPRDGYDPAISPDGRYVAFFSAAGLTPGAPEFSVYLRDLVAETTEIVSLAPGEEQATTSASLPSISAAASKVAFVLNHDRGDEYLQEAYVRDRIARQTHALGVTPFGDPANSHTSTPLLDDAGRKVAFIGSASDLVRRDVNATTDIFVRDLETGATQLVSRNSRGVQSNSFAQGHAISGNGNRVAWTSDATNLTPTGTVDEQAQVYVRDLATRRTRLVSRGFDGGPGDGWSYSTALSRTGRFVVFVSAASNIVRGDTNGVADVFVRDLRAGMTRRVSVSSRGHQGNAISGLHSGIVYFHYYIDISANGRYVSFYSEASNLVDRDLNLAGDIFVHDRHARQTSRVSLDADGNEILHGAYQGSLSNDGRWVAFSSDGVVDPTDNDGELDVFVRGPLDDSVARASR